MCGEHNGLRYDSGSNWGSSPHVRGTHADRAAHGAVIGIIPACAGNTPSSRKASSLPRDHPRMCGEHLAVSLIRPSKPGSSPHVRGTQRAWHKRAGRHGIIPACAGNTCWSCSRKAFTWDHPRMCGEHPITVIESTSRWGSSPHVRGTREPPSAGAELRGIIPACAGNTCVGHGKRRNMAGIIPACAGNTRIDAQNRLPTRDHPRMCGEHVPTASVFHPLTGSSPHVRGTRGGAP